MNTKLKKALTVVGAVGALTLVVSACASSSGGSNAASGAQVACSSVSDDLTAAQTALDADQNAADKAKGTPNEKSANAKVKADNAKIKTLQDRKTACAASASPSASVSPSPSASTKVVSCDSVDKQLTDVQAKIAALQKTSSASPTATASASATASPTTTASPSASPSASASATADPSTDMTKLQDQANELKAEIASAGCKSVSADQAITELVGQNGLFQGYQPGQVNVGTSHIDWASHQELRGIASFGTVTLKTPQAVGQYLSGSSAQDVTARNQVEQAITTAGYGQTEIDRALNGSGYFPVQPTVASQILGTSYFQNGKVYVEGTWRSVGPNDVYWVFMTVDHKIIPQATIRADCQNPHAVVITPIPPNKPTPPPITCGTNCPTPTPTPSPSCKPFPNPYGNGFHWVGGSVCNWIKPPQSRNCMLNGSWTNNCPPNHAGQPVQSNPGQPTGKTSGAPTSAPPYNPPTPNPTTGPAPTPESTGPGYNSGGGTGSAPGGTTCQQNGTCATSTPS
ncbi:MAG TPA: hypothetical protein V6C72_01905, partial [Chroococcales cyanobacterium]